MSDSSVSWIGLGLSALLIVDKLVSRSKRLTCKCCGLEVDSQSTLSPIERPTRKRSIDIHEVKIEKVQES